MQRGAGRRRVHWIAIFLIIWLVGTALFALYRLPSHNSKNKPTPPHPVPIKTPHRPPPEKPVIKPHSEEPSSEEPDDAPSEESEEPVKRKKPVKQVHEAHHNKAHEDLPGIDACGEIEDIGDLLIKDEPEEGTEKDNICPICGHKEHHEYAKENKHILAQCDNCGFLYINPMPFGISPDKTFHESWVNIKVDAMKKKVTDFYSTEELRDIENWLDIGAGNGELLKAVQKIGGHINATGLENSDYKIKGAAAHGIHHVKRDLATIEEKFDVVSVMNVLSHVSRPVGFFSAISRLLKPNGCIFMSTGNAADVEAQQNPGRKGDKFSLPDHLVFAGKKHVYSILCRAGLNVTDYREYLHFWHNYNPLPKGPFRAVYVRACRVPGVQRPWFEHDHDQKQ